MSTKDIVFKYATRAISDAQYTVQVFQQHQSQVRTDREGGLK